MNNRVSWSKRNIGIHKLTDRDEVGPGLEIYNTLF